MQIDQRSTMYTSFLILSVSLSLSRIIAICNIPVPFSSPRYHASIATRPLFTVFRPVATPRGSPSCQRTSTGMRNLSDASDPISPCPSAGRPPPRAAASSDHPAGRLAPACYRTRPSAGSTPMGKTEWI